jgi:hypothetical protein
MSKYIIEGNIDFYDELYKSLTITTSNVDTDTSNNICQISGLLLTDNNVTLECKHKYNYDALYKEICKQKYVFRTYNIEALSKYDYQRFREENVDYYIRCPYCRHVQFTLLPYYENSGCEKKYGINSLVKEQNDTNYLVKNGAGTNYHYSSYGYTFYPGVCCKIVEVIDGKNIFCTAKSSALVPMMNKSFCVNHIRPEVKQYNKEKKEQEKALKKEQKVLEKEKIKIEKQLEKKLEKESKKKTVTKNTVIKNTIQIGEFDNNNNSCSSVLKSGVKKGEQCGAKVKQDGLCARHLPKEKKEDKQDNI